MIDPLDAIRTYLFHDSEHVIGEELCEIMLAAEEDDAVVFVAKDLYGDDIAWAVISLGLLEGLHDPIAFFETAIIDTLDESFVLNGRAVYMLGEID